ncbi:aldehyde dehydrogenase family protein [Bradyrhizobium japonicum]|uniref:aldehyde dehydrogenase family protein n=1 Tax=Bradyrhizobium japonicum TaxID=375 RepID=UPI000456B404|nr:aldehyde dehydrogenase family protein [Bradyrhizobium japonicum]AHY52810.1 putative membrane-anchored aldehyde dehydrogenase protein [Bradyrhizobium japonicum SEMIA 5079]MCD9108321.1 aldehyde dehydrogenase family protein [Bradyrhizobium japonicum]MCD9256341.1 aldehyde dehydrogenase family protein [Bradyrhizobium japonicum SEMIA 5079]MCD9822127.1 aldehyde dehydrogenase family protein [Bradyrhizobium japonicum]MCD9894147.1 aldehyde dehydrogenase family protein [Bradyrhizobium japonicum]
MSIAHYYETMDYGPAPEADGEARAWLKRHDVTFGHFIAGKFVAPASGKHLATIEPATGKTLANIAQGIAADVEAAVGAARSAQSSWAKLGGHGRARHLYALARMLQRHARLFAVLEAIDNGKPIRETRDLDVPLAARHFLYHAGWAQLQDREFVDHVPVGVIGQIIPWNFPLLMLAWKIAPALATGNTVVLKPAEFTSLTALLFAELAAEAGLPPGVLNVVTGDGVTGALLVENPGIDKIAFTGSTEVGRLIRRSTAGSGKSLTLELGGKSPFIVFDDADIDGAVEGVVDAIWFNQGQVCCAGSRLLLQEGIAETFRKRLIRRMETLRVGPPLDKAIDMGAVVAPVQLERIKALVETGVKEGAEKYQAPGPIPAEGCFYPPTLLWNVHPSSTVAIEEIFGPVLVAMTFRTPDEAVMLANNTRYGLAASVWSETIGLALDIAPKLQAGVVWVNATNLFDASVGFGGYRESGFGREGGREGLYEYLKPKAWSGRKARAKVPPPSPAASHDGAGFGTPSIDRTAKLFVGGKQVRPDGNYSRAVLSPKGKHLGEAGEGNRKDIRNAVAAARSAEGWARATTHNRAQILYYLAENLSARADEFARRIGDMTGVSPARARAEVEASIERLFSYGAWADKYEGTIHAPPLRGVALAMHEPIGVVGVACPDEAPLLGFISLVAPLIAMGNRVVAVPSERHPLAATDFYQVLETSDVPAGVVNIVTGERDALAKVLAEHDDVDALWVFGSQEASTAAERLSIGNLKRTLVDHGLALDWYDRVASEGPILLRHAVQVKNIWIPYGD